MTEQTIEQDLIAKLVDLKYTYRQDIRNRATLEKNFREKFEALNRVRLTEGEFSRLLEEIVTSDVFAAARTLRERNSFTRDDGTLLNYTLVNSEALTDRNFVGILPNEAVITNFSFQNLCGCYEEIRALSNMAGQGILSQGLIRNLPFCVPKGKAEQQHIADCLSSLDNFITAETQKFEALTRHKRGLMQQLFPSPKEVAG